MKNTNQKCMLLKQANIFSFLVTSIICLSMLSATAQSVAGNQNNGGAQSKHPISKQEYYQQHPTSVQKPLYSAAERKALIAPSVKESSTANKKQVQAASIADKKNQAVSMDQLQLQKKEATNKGLPTTQHDKAMSEMRINQAK